MVEKPRIFSSSGITSSVNEPQVQRQADAPWGNSRKSHNRIVHPLKVFLDVKLLLPPRQNRENSQRISYFPMQKVEDAKY
jgi:hypothetical protein